MRIVWWFDSQAAPGWHDWLGLFLTVAGFWIAIAQLRKTRTATQAAASELERARRKLNGDQLSAVVPQLQTVVADLDFAVDNNDREVAHRALLRFGYVATESISLLDNRTADHSALKTRLSEVASSALDVKATIVGRRNVDVARTAKAVTKEIAALSVEIAGLVAGDRYQLGGEENVH
ncbi:hypothetical protein LXM50_05655 [Microbacterium sp. Au-Mic1]|uniref:hypothetical protein n=1 Tax=Microbacterium sp. Au-Mic1 TaxID=2906457 RepID=UPI001E4E3D01|nr:hypothetical protein [Microbacterium sp. Au-Mic1]MCE4025451.1 hypothetical protein [Microbacterium sp. Au-Mic1]